MNIPVSKYGSSVSLRCSQGYDPVGQVSKPDLTKRKRKSKAEKKWQQGVKKEETGLPAIQGVALLPEQPKLNISEEEKKAVTNLL